MIHTFFFASSACSEMYTLSLHDALPILAREIAGVRGQRARRARGGLQLVAAGAAEARLVRAGVVVDVPALREERKSTRLNSSHVEISYAVFCLKKKRSTSFVRLTTNSDG